MIRDNQQFLNRLHVLIDAGVVAVSYALAYFVKFSSGLFANGPHYDFLSYCVFLLVIVPGYLILYFAFNLYTPKRVQGRRLELSNILKANSIGMMIFIVVLYLSHNDDFSRGMMVIFLIINICLETLVRNVIRLFLRDIRKKGFNVKHILLVGYSRAAEEYIDRIKANPQWGYDVRGILDDNVEAGTEYRGIKILGRIENLLVILPQNSLDEIAITLGLDEYSKLQHIVAQCEKSGVHTKFIPDYNNIIPTKPYTEDLMGLPVINIRYVPLTNTFNSIVKRIMDFFGSIIMIVVLSPLMLITAIAIKVTSPGPLIFKQERVGLHNKPFMMYKFRSMEVQDKATEAAGWTVKNDPRVTPIGKFIRKTSIDELPQLFNVVKGEMSLVGPRPERPQFVEKFREEIPRYMVKHQVRPGMTGWAQVNGYRGNTSIRKRIDHDLYYIENWSIGLDIKILFLTIFKGFVNENAY